MKVIERKSLRLWSIRPRLTLGFMQLFDLQRVAAENFVGADVDGSTARIYDQNFFAGLSVCVRLLGSE